MMTDRTVRPTARLFAGETSDGRIGTSEESSRTGGCGQGWADRSRYPSHAPQWICAQGADQAPPPHALPRRGVLAASQRRAEVRKQVRAVVRAGRGLGVVLHAEDRQLTMPHPFERLVIQV